MSLIERGNATDIMMKSGGTLDTYVKTRRDIERAITKYFEPETGWWFDNVDFYSISDRIGHLIVDDRRNEAAVRGAILMAAFAYRGRAFASETVARGEDKQPEFVDLGWRRGSEALKMAEQASVVVEGVVPEISGQFTDISLERLRKTFWEAIDRGRDEFAIITGAHGAGKTTILTGVTEFMRRCGLRVRVEKFPRQEGLLSNIIQPVLKGKLEWDPRSLQFLILADTLNQPQASGEFVFYDRFTTTESLVYSPEGVMETVMLATSELFADRPMHVYWIDRHPSLCVERVAARDTEPRIFERDVEQFVHQQIRFAGLTALPSVVCVNNDFSPLGMAHGEAEKIATSRVIVSMWKRQIIQRALVSQGVVPDMFSAQMLSNKKLVEWDALV